MNPKLKTTQNPPEMQLLKNLKNIPATAFRRGGRWVLAFDLGLEFSFF